jgi:hypothetical protein
MPISLRFVPYSPFILCACGRLARSGISGCFYEINAKLRRDATGVCQPPLTRAVDSLWRWTIPAFVSQRPRTVCNAEPTSERPSNGRGECRLMAEKTHSPFARAVIRSSPIAIDSGYRGNRTITSNQSDRRHLCWHAVARFKVHGHHKYPVRKQPERDAKIRRDASATEGAGACRLGSCSFRLAIVPSNWSPSESL